MSTYDAALAFLKQLAIIVYVILGWMQMIIVWAALWNIAPFNVPVGLIYWIPLLYAAAKEDLRQRIAQLFKHKEGMENTEKDRKRALEEIEKERAKKKQLASTSPVY